MKLAFLTGALAGGSAAAAITALTIWVLTVLGGSADAWSVAPLLIGVTGVAFGTGTYLAERTAHRRTLARKRAAGEPWAFRER